MTHTLGKMALYWNSSFKLATGSLGPQIKSRPESMGQWDLMFHYPSLWAYRVVPIPNRNSIGKSHLNCPIDLLCRNTFLTLILPCGMHMGLRTAFDFYKQTKTACNAVSSQNTYVNPRVKARKATLNCRVTVIKAIMLSQLQRNS